MENRLQELSSQGESHDLIQELSWQLSKHNSRVWELIQDPNLAEGEVAQWITVGLMASQPLEADFFPGILEGLVRRLGLAPAGTTDPPASIKEGVMRCWVAAIREALQDEEGPDPRAALTVTPHGLHLDYNVEFHSRRVGDIAPTFTSLLLPNLVREHLWPEKPEPTRCTLPSADLPETPSQPPPSGEADQETDKRLSPSCEIAQEILSPESPSSDDGNGISVVSSKMETPGSLKVKFSFQKKKKEGEPKDAPGKGQSSQSGLPSTGDDERVSVVSLSDEDGSDKGDAGTSTDVGVPPPSRK